MVKYNSRHIASGSQEGLAYLATALAPHYDDMRGAAVAQGLDVVSGRVDYNYDELTIDFAVNARYPEEALGISNQLSHRTKEGEQRFGAHIHWHQTEDADPNWLIAWRYYNNGQTPGAFTLSAPLRQRVFPYVEGTIVQITTWPAIIVSDARISGFLDVKLYRDTGNNSALFAGADTYSTSSQLKFFDVHVLYDTSGSLGEYAK